jgi:hypothetical protein
VEEEGSKVMADGSSMVTSFVVFVEVVMVVEVLLVVVASDAMRCDSMRRSDSDGRGMRSDGESRWMRIAKRKMADANSFHEMWCCWYSGYGDVLL